MTALLEVQGLSKSFGSVQALTDATLTLPRGEVTAIIGDNGAGKSTLVRCITGVHQPDTGTIALDGQAVAFSTPEASRSAGIETVFQDLALVEDLTVAQNLFLGREPRRGPLLDRRRMKSEAAAIVATLSINVPRVGARVRRLSGGQRQAVAIARAAGWSSKLVIMDEPTAALGVQETERVEALIADLRSRGTTIMLISHNFEQVLRISDSVQVMRAGRTVARRRTSATDPRELVGLVTGAIDDESSEQE